MSDLPGFYRDPETNRYYRVTDQPVPPEVKARKQRLRIQKASFNNFPAKLKFVDGTACNKFNLPYALEMQKQGRTVSQNLNMEVLRLKFRNWNFSRYSFSTLEEEDLSPCKWVTPFEDGFLGVWSRLRPDENGSSVLQVANISETDDCEISCYVDYNHEVVDVCSIKLPNDTVVGTYLTNSNTPGVNGYNLCVLVYHSRRVDNDGSHYYHYSVKTTHGLYHTLRCCAWNHSSDPNIVIGTEVGNYIGALAHNFTLLSDFKGDVNAVEFSNGNGKTFFCATNRGDVNLIDTRSRRHSKAFSIGSLIMQLKMLQNGNEMIVSGYENKLLLYDIRMNQPLFTYEHHVNSSRRIPVTFSETWNILCCNGDDDVTRFWSLREGKPISSIGPPEDFEKVISVIKEKDTKLYSFVFTRDKIYRYTVL